MPLLFYFPFIVWMGMVRDEMRVPQYATAHALQNQRAAICRQPSRFWWLSVILIFRFGHRQQTRRFRQTRRNVGLVKQDLTASSVESERSRGP